MINMAYQLPGLHPMKIIAIFPENPDRLFRNFFALFFPKANSNLIYHFPRFFSI